MRYLLTILLTLGIWSGAMAQDRTSLIRHDHDDVRVGEDRQRIKRRHLYTEIDSTRFRMSAWNGECYFEVDFLSDTAAITDYRIGMRNGHKLLRIGNDDYRARIYMTRYGALEFDAIVRHMVDSQYKVSVPITTKGLTFWYQDTLLDVDKLDSFRPDSVVGSYAIFHSTKMGNVTYSDGRSDIYMSGKFAHMFCPTIWDANGDSAKGFVEIVIDSVVDDISYGWMTIGATQEWSATAEAPVTIDPVFGHDDIGATSSNAVTGERIWALGPHEAASDGDADSMSIYITSGTGTRITLGLYDNNGSNKAGALQADGDGGYTSAVGWNIQVLDAPTAITGSTPYWLAVMMENNTPMFKYDAVGGFARWRNSAAYVDGTLNDPFPGTAVQSTNRKYSIFVYYTTEAGIGGWQGQVIPVTIQ